MTDKINNSILEANIKLVDDNKVLEKDNRMLKRRIERAIQFLEPYIEFGEDIKFKGNMMEPLLDILKGNAIDE